MELICSCLDPGVLGSLDISLDLGMLHFLEVLFHIEWYIYFPAFEQKLKGSEGVSHLWISGESVRGRRNSKCKGPGADTCLMCRTTTSGQRGESRGEEQEERKTEK